MLTTRDLKDLSPDERQRGESLAMVLLKDMRCNAKYIEPGSFCRELKIKAERFERLKLNDQAIAELAEHAFTNESTAH